MDQPIQPTQDNDFYFQTVVFRVGNTLFRVPKNAFNVPGTAFEAMFLVPPTADTEPEGLSDGNPIVLNVDEGKFKAFLRVICGSRIQKLTDEDWLGALDLATMWTFDDVRREAIQALDEWSGSQSVKQIILTAKKYNIVSWLKTAYTQLVVDPHEALPFAELSNPPAVDWETIAKLLQIKHQHAMVVHGGCFSGNRRSRCAPQFGGTCDEIVGSMVENMFKEELNIPSTIEVINLEEDP